MIRIPQELKDFSILLNPTNLKAFNKIELFNLSRKVLKTEVPPLAEETQSALSEGLVFRQGDLGTYALRVYFYQILINKPFSLDLRGSRFWYDTHWRFNGESLGFEFDSSFLVALSDTYSIYYQDSAPSLRNSLRSMGLIQSDWSERDAEDLEGLFLKHFNEGRSEAQNFKLSGLLHSFANIFSFIKSRNSKVPSQFGILGVCLTSLYMTLDPIEEPLDVRSCFEHALRVTKAKTDQRMSQ
jgi:hypothetical protein